jgi:opacity protein-like surface antigen
MIEYTAPPVEIGSAWYLRGDVGYKKYRTPSAHFDEPDYGDMINETITDAGMVGIGAGYKVNRWFRVDGTLDYEWPGQFRGNLPCPVANCGAGPLYSTEFAKISAWTGLINGYVDLGTYGTITPYVGAGVGFSYITTSDVNFINPDGSQGSWSGASKWNLAWALMAGFGVDLSKHWTLDVNYRYLNLGKAVSGITSAASGTQPIHYDDLAASEIRVGLRYNIW